MKQWKDIGDILQQNSATWFSGWVCQPETEATERIVRTIRQVLLPNYMLLANGESLPACIGHLHRDIACQVHRAMFRRCPEDGTPESQAIAEAKADALVHALPALQRALYEDVQATYHGDPAADGYDEIILSYPGVLALIVYRTAHELFDLRVPFLPRMMTEYAHRLTGIDIHPGAVIGKGIMIDHGTGVVIGETAIVGDHVNIYQGVTIGALYLPRDETGFVVRRTKRHPTIEDHVVLYANATVLGGETVIGHHSVVGSNAWVTRSVPPYSKVRYQSENVVHIEDGLAASK